jgi:hypothetical protein
MTSGRVPLLIVGNPTPFHIGSHLREAAQTLSIAAAIEDTRAAFDAPWPVLQVNWRLLGRRPPRLAEFSRRVEQRCQADPPRWLLATGAAPLTAGALQRLGHLGIERLSFLTDDPWNPAQRAGWLLDALPHYDQVFTPRRANMDDLRRLGCPQVHYLPFAYAPHVHFPQAAPPEEQSSFACDLLFYGGADKDRLPVVSALLKSGLDVHLYGGYWDRHAATRPAYKGHADPATLRKAVAGAAITLCLVRRANRDGHVMRTFEAPAMGGCMLVEDTAEQRALLGEEGAAVLYFANEEELMAKAASLLAHPEQRLRLAGAAHAAITQGGHTYAHRLATMLAQDAPPSGLPSQEIV